ncbi:hypothetical protein VPH35_077277 [Triticum aestivum]
MFRSETLLWINLLNRDSTPFSRSATPRSSACSCAASQTTLFFWNLCETRDHLLPLVTPICFSRRHDADSSRQTTMSLASTSSLTVPQPWAVALPLVIFLKGFCAFFARRTKDSILI